jgi:hypothetical protein
MDRRSIKAGILWVYTQFAQGLEQRKYSKIMSEQVNEMTHIIFHPYKKLMLTWEEAN